MESMAALLTAAAMRSDERGDEAAMPASRGAGETGVEDEAFPSPSPGAAARVARAYGEALLDGDETGDSDADDDDDLDDGLRIPKGAAKSCDTAKSETVARVAREFFFR